MDPIPEVNDDAAAPGVVRPSPAPISPVGAPPADAVDAGEGAAVPNGGSLAETESLLGAVIAADRDGEAAALRRTLDLDGRPPSATPTRDEALEQSAALRRSVSEPSSGRTATAVDPTARYEVHDSALGGNPLAQAIDDTAIAQRAAQAQAARADQRDDVVVRQEHVPAATDRATQDAGAAATTQAGAGRPPSQRDRNDVAAKPEEERVERVERLAEAQRARNARSRETDAR